GVDDAKYGVRIGAAQQQTRDAVDQDLCLARSRIGGDPGVGVGLGGAGLAVDRGLPFDPGVVERIAGRAHSASSSTVHSPRRARRSKSDCTFMEKTRGLEK